MSFHPSTRDGRVTRAWFPICLTRQSHSQAHFCSYALRTIADRAECTFASLRYSLGGNRPSQTTHLALFLDRIHGPRLDPQPNEGGIPRLAPRGLAPSLQSLPPILYTLSQEPMPGCSKGSRGLSVLLRVTSVFTGISTSPGPWRRQCSDRYAIRAGRNLPDKEFRYLRTVIVTAAVYRGFSSLLRAEALTNPLNLPAPGRRHSLYVALRLSRELCF